MPLNYLVGRRMDSVLDCLMKGLYKSVNYRQTYQTDRLTDLIKDKVIHRGARLQKK